MLTGYAHPDYARSLSAYGSPRELLRCGGWVLERAIPGTPYRDAMGCYPLFTCRDWSQLKADLDELASDLVSVCLVLDPFGRYAVEEFRECFPDKFLPFKEHYILDTTRSIKETVSKSARRDVKAALRRLHVELCPNPTDHLDDWVRLYGCLIERHDLKGMHRFSRGVFLQQMRVPGFLLLRAASGQDTVGMMAWYVQGDVAYNHLVCMDSAGYKLGAGYAMYWSAIQYFSGKVRWIDFTGTAGTRDNSKDGLAEFKRKWSSGTKPTYLCGRIFDRARYDEIVKAEGIAETDYFPAYRLGEFNPAAADTNLAGRMD